VTVLQWSGEFRIDDGPMDEIHVEFIDALNALAAAEGDVVLPTLDAFIAHTERHFAEEEAWMAASDFPRIYCHSTQHASVLQVAHEVRERIVNGEANLGPLLATAVGEWFRDHAATMDAMLAQYMNEQGFLPEPLSVWA
jgi:hemerythrin